MADLGHRRENDVHAQAAEYVLGLLSAEEALAFQHQVADGDPAAQEALLSMEETAARLALAAPVEKPCGGVRAKLLRRIQKPEKAVRVLPGFVEEKPGFHVLAGGQGKWREIGVNGVAMQVLSHDPAADALTMLLRMAPGAVLPRHKHTKEEQCWVLEGDVRQVDGSVRMKAGDFFRAMAGTDHDPITTDGGCLLLIVGGAKDEGR